jgi:DNA-binding response OmpR family regulator
MGRSAVVLEADRELGRRVKAIILGLGRNAVVVHHRAAVLRALADHAPELVVLQDALVDRDDGLELATRIRRDHTSLPIVLVTHRGLKALAVAALRGGVRDYFAEPLDSEEVAARA